MLWDGEWGGGRKPGERSPSRWKSLFSSNLQLPCCRALPSSQSNPDWRMGAQTPPQVGVHFPKTCKSEGCLSPPTNTSQQAPLLLLGLCTHFLIHPARGSREPLPQPKQGARPPGTLTYGAAIHAGVGGPWLGRAGARREQVFVVPGRGLRG